MSTSSIMQTVYAGTPIPLEGNDISVPNKGPRRAPKKIKASLELYLDEVGKTLKFYASSEEHIVVVIFNDKGMFEQENAIDITPNTESIISIKALEKGEHAIRVYNKGVESKGIFTLQ